MDDYSFGWTSAAGIIADFCAVGGTDHEARVPAAEHDRLLVRSSRQLPPPDQVDGYFWVVGGTGTGPSLEGVRAGVRHASSRKQHVGQPVLLVPRRACQDVAPRLVGSYVGGVRHRRRACKTQGGELLPGASRRRRTRVHRRQRRRSGSSTTTTRRRKALVHGLNAVRRRRRREAAAGAADDALGRVRRSRTAGTSSSTRTARRSRTSDQLQIVQGADGDDGHATTSRYVPNVDQTFGGTVQRSRARRPAVTQPAVREEEAAVAGQDQVPSKNGVVTTTVIK